MDGYTNIGLALHAAVGGGRDDQSLRLLSSIYQVMATVGCGRTPLHAFCPRIEKYMNQNAAMSEDSTHAKGGLCSK